MKTLNTCATIVGFALLTGCISMQRAPDEAQEVAGTLAKYEYLSTLKAEEQRREFNTAQLAYERTPNDTTRLNLALILLLPRAPWHDDTRVQALLGGIKASADKPYSPRHDLAQLLLRLLAEHQREQREEKRKTEEMQQKIEALRAIDKDLGLRRKTP